ncbi:MAG: hypothetical protein NDP16_05290 [Crenarchaeota archaeon]|nr:hypothetical protein [Thermoproteota archaeon]MCR8463539.1 hypothetical protein [Thermoproteota archaeon]MCR8472445.1 hypothetical protein [Thermoproteota archaeon]MCR8473584.1 hypothetical protein [Thermoproteota archaeon]MCR8489047.1 hypothetical protein [Thermoproteota archaeon]
MVVRWAEGRKFSPIIKPKSYTLKFRLLSFLISFIGRSVSIGKNPRIFLTPIKPS